MVAMNEAPEKRQRFSWVRLNDRGHPTVRNWNVFLVVLGPLGGFLAAQGVLPFVFDTPFRPWIACAFCSAYLLFILTLIELQRQNLLRDRSSLRFDLKYLFLLTFLAAAFVGSIAAQIRDTQLGFRISEQVKSRIQERIDGVDVYIGSERGRNISCVVKRTSFSDDELKELIEITRDSDTQACELTMLVLEGTQVSDDGLKQLSECRKLENLSLPSIALSDDTLARIEECRSLKYLTFAEQKVAERQRNLLYQKLPNTKINGRTLSERQSVQDK